jgi:hypothetical protein
MRHSAMRCPEQQGRSTCRHGFILTIPYNARLYHGWMLLRADARAVIFIFYHSDHIPTLFIYDSQYCHKERIQVKCFLPSLKEADLDHSQPGRYAHAAELWAGMLDTPSLTHVVFLAIFPN